ncbi:MAG: DNA-binding protein [Pedobacter sp.]|nr:MAG: DNA-binding protein [Pedobacter sp.]
MSSNIIVVRVCEHCGCRFEAKKTTTKYCSMKCNRTAYKQKIRKGKIEVSDKQTALLSPRHYDLAQSKDFLTVKDLALLLDCCRQTVYSLVKSGRITAVNVLEKKILIPRYQIDKLFLPDDQLPVAPDIQKIMRIEACYHIGEVERKYNVSNKTLYELIKRHEIPKLKCGKFTYVPKSMIDKLFKS